MSKAESTGMSRRDLLRRGTAAGVAVGGVGYGSLRLDHGPVQNSQAIAPVVAAGAVGGSVAVGWALREFEILGSNPPADGLTESALWLGAYDTAKARKSTNQSTIIDNRTIIDGVGNTAYADGKIAAIESLNEQNQQETVADDGKAAVIDYEKTVVKNYLKTWNEAAEEFDSILSRIEEHSDAEIDRNAIDQNHNASSGSGYGTTWKGTPSVTMDYHTYEFDDGSTFDVHAISQRLRVFENTIDETSEMHYCPTKHTDMGTGNTTVTYKTIEINVPDSDMSIKWMDGRDWIDMFDELEATFTEVKDGLQNWVAGVYSDVQSGELDTSELLTPREQAELTSDDEDFPQAVADLQALNISVDLDREAEVYFPDSDATIYGTLGYTGDTTLEVGEVKPNATVEDEDGNEEDKYSGSFYITYDISRGEGTWSDYETGVDGGVVTFTSEPYENSLFNIETTSGEAAEVTRSDFEENDSGDYEADIKDQLEDAITDIDAVKFYSEGGETQYETIQLTETFEILSFTDDDGNSYDESNFERDEPQDDTNYISQEEWEQQQDDYEELIQKYEESQNGVTVPGVEDILAGEANSLIGIAVVGFVLVSAVLSALNPLS